MAKKVKISEDLKKSLNKEKAKNYKQKEKKRLQSMSKILKDKDLRLDNFLDHTAYNILCSKLSKELGIPKEEVSKTAHDF